MLDYYTASLVTTSGWLSHYLRLLQIHERSGREKIFSNNVAHVLNDEVSRKYIQSLKRVLTFAQSKRPPDDLSQR